MVEPPGVDETMEASAHEALQGEKHALFPGSCTPSQEQLTPCPSHGSCGGSKSQAWGTAQVARMLYLHIMIQRDRFPTLVSDPFLSYGERGSGGEPHSDH